MRFTEYLTAQYFLTILVIVFIFLLLIPFPTQAVPRWKVLLIDENYLPGAKRTLVQTIDNGYFRHHTEYKADTDKNGFVTFPERYIWAGAIHRIGELGAMVLGWDTTTKVTIKAESGCDRGEITWDSGKSALSAASPDKLVCP